MTERLKPGDRVRIDGGQNTWTVQEIEPAGAVAHAPSTYVVVIAPDSGKGQPQVYGNHKLEKVR